ncbi:hypothetical protein Tco_0347855 [Tanacetum coccineum]
MSGIVFFMRLELSTLLKQQYENFVALSSESIDQAFDRLQKLISQLEIQGEVINQEDMNLKLLRSLPSEWKTHALIWRNKVEIKTITLDDLYNNLKLYEQEITGAFRIANMAIGFCGVGMSCFCCGVIIWRRIIKTIHVDFEELTAMDSEHSSLEPILHEMTLATISSGLVPNRSPLTPFVLRLKRLQGFLEVTTAQVHNGNYAK